MLLEEDSRHAIQVYEEQVLPTFAEAAQNSQKVTRNTIVEEQETAQLDSTVQITDPQ